MVNVCFHKVPLWVGPGSLLGMLIAAYKHIFSHFKMCVIVPDIPI